jgi:hypothetical protein
MRHVLLCLLLSLLAIQVHASPVDFGDGTWTVMPVGARPTYMGIHGGTMPVSLMVSMDGASLVTFVGRTGNDFLAALHLMQVPSLLNATIQQSFPVDGIPAADGNISLMAGSARECLPVVHIAGLGLRGTDAPGTLLQPFGLSDKPLSIEGSVVLPMHTSPKHAHPFFKPHYLQPRRSQD